MHCTRHRVFLAVLICAAKYLNDSSPKNMHWQKYGRFFNSAEVNLMEKQLLFLLDYRLRVEEDELLGSQRAFWQSLTVEQPVEQASSSKRRAESDTKPLPARATTYPVPGKRLRTPRSSIDANTPAPTSPDYGNVSLRQSAPWSSRRVRRGSVETPDDSPIPRQERHSSVTSFFTSYSMATLRLDASSPAEAPELERRSSDSSIASIASSASSTSSISSTEELDEEPTAVLYKTSQGRIRAAPAEQIPVAESPICEDAAMLEAAVQPKKWSMFSQASLRTVKRVVPGAY